ncbi:MAG: hypothetical protein EAZ42_10115 [Verrucomicrobia bacterium]|nr:MAG: hypothetical protein EAZ42_10115 [Verrucomicrobiota bacterium]
MQVLSLILLMLAMALPLSAESPTDKALAAEASVVRRDDGMMQIGKILFDSKTREIRVPTTVNMAEGLLEFLLVHEKGKIHESLLTTDASATDLNLAMKLLDYRESPELYRLLDENGFGTNNFPVVDDAVKAAARIQIELEWSDAGTTRRFPASDLIQQKVLGTSMPAGPWVYGGSGFSNGRFSAETTGDMIAIYTSSAALINFPGDGRLDDLVWFPFPNRVPPVKTPVVLIITPFR